MCKISIIVPLYNGECTIGRCLDSLINQTIDDIEVVVVDDGSKDKGPDIVRKYTEKDNRIRLITQENAGSGTARNVGIKNSKGKYVGFVDCDDFVDKEMFLIMTNALEQFGTSIAICQEKNVYLENDNIQLINETKFPVGIATVYENSQILEWLLNYTYMSLNSLCYKVIARDFFEQNNVWIPEGHRQAEDMVTSIGILSNVKNVTIVPQSLYYYVHTKGSQSYAYSLRRAEDIYLDWIEAKEYIIKSNYKGSFDNFSLGMYFTSLKQLYWNLDKKEKNSIESKKLIEKWNNAKKENKWRPSFKNLEIPILHKIKIWVSYLGLSKLFFSLIKMLQWIPFFKYMV